VVAEDPDRAELAARFVRFVDSEDGRTVMRRYGFLLPDEQPPARGDR
jgi:ABC-type molybdate transport system substrate-binding protein